MRARQQNRPSYTVVDYLAADASAVGNAVVDFLAANATVGNANVDYGTAAAPAVENAVLIIKLPLRLLLKMLSRFSASAWQLIALNSLHLG